ncbi:hypothetical protein RYH73_09500 [Olivibacter sp. CPCC 100613]|uniref:CBU_0592 family membrane protein n=1 Tax=Olivibacter sp. CPCC 100613 TaxID=3079931 RepID=UPI002FF82331
MSAETINFLGWIGVASCTTGYLLVSVGYILSNSWKYQLLNAIGGLFLVISAVYNHDTPNTVANGLWALIGFVSLLKFSLLATSKKAVAKR